VTAAESLASEKLGIKSPLALVVDADRVDGNNILMGEGRFDSAPSPKTRR